MSAEKTMSWHEGNQAYLTHQLATMRQTLERYIGSPDDALEDMAKPAVATDIAQLDPPPAIERLSQVFGLSAFERSILLLCAGEAPRLLRNDGGNRRHWLGVALQGTTSNRDAVGARVTVTAGGRARTKLRTGGTSYLSASDPRLLFGLGSESRVERLEVRWPTGRVERYPEPAVDRYLTLKEGAGRIDARS